MPPAHIVRPLIVPTFSILMTVGLGTIIGRFLQDRQRDITNEHLDRQYRRQTSGAKEQLASLQLAERLATRSASKPNPTPPTPGSQGPT